MRVLSQNGYDDRIFSFGLNGLGHTQLAYLSLARLRVRHGTSQECFVRGARRRARERQPKTPGPSVALGWKAICAYS